MAPQITDSLVDAILPHLVPALQAYLASADGQARLHQLVDEIVKYAISKLATLNAAK